MVGRRVADSGRGRRGQLEIEQVAAAGEVERSGRQGVALVLLEDVFDVLAGEGVSLGGVADGAGDRLAAVDVGQGDDMVDVEAWLEAAGAELAVVGFGLGAQGVEGQQPGGIAGAAAAFAQVFGVVGVLEVAVALVAARVGGDQVVGMIEAEPVGEGMQGQALGGVECGHRVAVGVDDDAAAVGDPHDAGHGRVGGHRRQRAQGGGFQGEEFARGLAGLLVEAHVGHCLQPLARGDVERVEGGRHLQAGEEVVFDVADEVLDLPLFVGLAHVAGAGAKP